MSQRLPPPPPPPPLYSTFRFVSTTGHTQNGRKQIATRACDECRRKKKRCTHVATHVDSEERPSAAPGPSHIAPEAENSSARRAGQARPSHGLGNATPAAQTSAWRPLGDQPTQSPYPSGRTSTPMTRHEASTEVQRARNSFAARGSSNASPVGYDAEHIRKWQKTTSHAIQERFVGDLNPEVELLRTANNHERPRQNAVGLWHQDSEAPDQPSPSLEQDYFSSTSLFHTCSAATRKLLRPLLVEQCSNAVPSRETFAQMADFYWEYIHPILPAVDETDHPADPDGNPASILQAQVICLLTCADEAMRWHRSLRLDDFSTADVAEFAHKVLDSMRLSIELGIVSDKTIVIRALAIMSITSYGRPNLEMTSQFFARAVHLAETIGLHQPRDAHRDKRVSDLFCLIWSIDRIHAAILGRPVLMHEIDMGKSVLTCVEESSSGFKVLVHIAALLDIVIALYRPNAAASEIPDRDFPLFEEVVAKCGATELHQGLLNTLELFYHAVGILSCRYRTGEAPVRNSRRDASALQILSIMDGSVMQPIWLLFVPYAVSLSLGTACRELRHSSVETRRSRAMLRIKKCCEHLFALGEIFWSATFMAEMGSKILHEAKQSHSHSLPNTAAATWNSVRLQPASPDSEGTFDLNHPGWNLNDVEGLLESNLDPSLPSFLQDLDFEPMI